MVESEEELKSLLMKVKEESKKAGSKLNIKKAKIMEYCAITSRQIDGGKAETVADFIFLGSKVTVDGGSSHKIKRRLLLGRKAMTNLSLATPWTPLSMGFSRQEYWSGLSFPSLGDLPKPGIKPASPALQVDSLPTEQ